MDSNSSNSFIPISIRIYWTHFTTSVSSVAASSGSKVLHSPYRSLSQSRVYFFTHAECFLLFFSYKLAAPKLHSVRLF